MTRVLGNIQKSWKIVEKAQFFLKSLMYHYIYMRTDQTCLKTEKYFSPYLKKVFMIIFVKKRPEITSKHLYFDRNPGTRLYSNLYLKNIDEFCLFCTLYLKKIDEVQVHGTFVLEMKIDLKYNLGYRMHIHMLIFIFPPRIVFFTVL